MTNIIIKKFESMLRGVARSNFRKKTFFEQMWLLFIIASIAQLYCQYISFGSELEWLEHNFSKEPIGALIVAGIFEVVKAIAVGNGIRAYFMEEPAAKIIIYTMIGASLSYGSWWMSDKGTFFMAEEQSGLAPIDTRSAEVNNIYTPKIEAIENRIDELESKNFYWCETHRINHKCEVSGYYVNPKERADKVALTSIEKLEGEKTALMATMNEQLKKADKEHSEAMDRFKTKRNNLHLALENKILYCEAITWLCLLFITYTYFRLFDGHTGVVTEDDDPTPTVTENEEDPTVGVTENDRQTPPVTDEELAQLGHVLAELAVQSPDVLDGVLARVEAEKKMKRQP